MTEEITSRKKKKRRKKHYFLRFIIVVAAAVGLYFLLTSELFTVKEIEVVGNRFHTVEQLIQISGAQRGKNLFEADLGTMKDKLLEDPFIKLARVSRKLPDTVEILVEEWEEAAVVADGQQYLLINEEGLVLRVTGTLPSLTLIEGLTIVERQPGKALTAEENSLFSKTLTLLKAMEEADLYFKKIEISKVTIKVYIYDNLTCEGTPENIMEGMDSLQEVLYDLYQKGIERGVIRVSGDGICSFNPSVE
ncbi:MAG: FtsQ-type POTRA domain-containing protein [Clostridiales bacterium]|nr:FtsQ-type POTRA domain-containing protein [Clostridiales bacterium]MBQ3107213.1 FtsQ-type POTRA domain-containing protein [Bacillota bacterium]